MMPLSFRLNSSLVAAGGVALVLSMYMGGKFVQERQTCETDEPSTCNSAVGDPSETVLETRDGDFIAKMKTDADVKEFRPENAYEYEACSKHTGTALMHMGTEVTNQWCQALGCNYKQCVQQKWACNQDDGTQKNSEPEIQCVAAMTQTNMNPAQFVALFFAFVASMLMCLGGCLAGAPSSGNQVERINIAPSPKAVVP